VFASIYNKLNGAAIFLERLMYFGITFGCGTKIDVFSSLKNLCGRLYTTLIPHLVYKFISPLRFSECNLLIFMEKGKGTPKCFCLWLGHYAIQTHSVVFLPCMRGS